MCQYIILQNLKNKNQLLVLIYDEIELVNIPATNDYNYIQ